MLVVDGAVVGFVEGCDGLCEVLAVVEGVVGGLLAGLLGVGVEGGGLLGGLDVVGVLGVLLGGVLGGVLGVLGVLLEPPGVLGVLLGVLGVLLGLPLGGPGRPEPLIATICPLGSKRTCACHVVRGSALWSTVMRIVVCAPGAMMPETALRESQGASAAALQETGAVPEFQSVTVTSFGLLERCVTLMFS